MDRREYPLFTPVYAWLDIPSAPPTTTTARTMGASSISTQQRRRNCHSDFEFELLTTSSSKSSGGSTAAFMVPADEIFRNGKLLPSGPWRPHDRIAGATSPMTKPKASSRIMDRQNSMPSRLRQHPGRTRLAPTSSSSSITCGSRWKTILHRLCNTSKNSSNNSNSSGSFRKCSSGSSSEDASLDPADLRQCSSKRFLLPSGTRGHSHRSSSGSSEDAATMVSAWMICEPQYRHRVKVAPVLNVPVCIGRSRKKADAADRR